MAISNNIVDIQALQATLAASQADRAAKFRLMQIARANFNNGKADWDKADIDYHNKKQAYLDLAAADLDSFANPSQATILAYGDALTAQSKVRAVSETQATLRDIYHFHLAAYNAACDQVDADQAALEAAIGAAGVNFNHETGSALASALDIVPEETFYLETFDGPIGVQGVSTNV